MQIIVTKYKRLEKESSLKGIFSILIPDWGNFYVNEMKFFQKNTQKWIGFPDRVYDQDGEKKRFSYAGFQNLEDKKAFEHEVLKAIEEYADKQRDNKFMEIEEQLPF